MLSFFELLPIKKGSENLSHEDVVKLLDEELVEYSDGCGTRGGNFVKTKAFNKEAKGTQ